jgi:NADH-quinone oxidoreductase subunit C
VDEKKIYEAILNRFGEDAVTSYEDEGVSPPVVRVQGEKICEVISSLRDDGTLLFDSLMCLSGADMGDWLEVVYHLHSMEHRHKITVKVVLDREFPQVPSISSIHAVANFHEREAYDLFGIVFSGHPDLRRILLPDDWPGNPLRKDYVYPDSYHGIKV